MELRSNPDFDTLPVYSLCTEGSPLMCGGIERLRRYNCIRKTKYHARVEENNAGKC